MVTSFDTKWVWPAQGQQNGSSHRPTSDRAIAVGAADPAPSTPEPETPSIPRRNAYRKWAELILRAAESTSDRYRLGDRKVYLCAVLDRLGAQLDPNDPMRCIGLAREVLPELNRRNLVHLSRCDMTQIAPDLAQRSALLVATASFHFIVLATSNPL